MGLYSVLQEARLGSQKMKSHTFNLVLINTTEDYSEGSPITNRPVEVYLLSYPTSRFTTFPSASY